LGQQEIDLVTLFKDVAHEFVEVCNTPEQARHLVVRPFRHYVRGRGHAPGG
jgi:pyruvate dehydrogenase (quinone)